MEKRKDISLTRRWVIKIGSALLTQEGCGLRRENLKQWVAQIVELRKKSFEMVIVSSGSIAEGISRLGWQSRPNNIHQLQAVSAIGQMGLIEAYESCFQQYGIHTAQILLTHDDIANRRRYLNARTSLNTLISMGVIPIINENDAVATDEIRFGDNDTLAALTANLIDAELLVLLTDQQGLYTSDPRHNQDATFIEEAEANDPLLSNYAGDSNTLGRGGMKTKLRAAEVASKSGAHTIIAFGNKDNILITIAQGNKVGTLLKAGTEFITARKQWLMNQSQINGSVVIDDGACHALINNNKSLLPIGVRSIEGDFKKGDIIKCVNLNNEEIARGIVNYSANEAHRIIGKPSHEIVEQLGYAGTDELIHRDNMAIL